MDYQTQVYQKLSAEYEDFLKSMEKLSGMEAIEHAYEKVFKEDILLCFEDMDLTPQQAKALLSAKDPLDECYRKWLKSDVSYMDDLRETVENTIGFLTKERQRDREQAR